MTNLRDLARGQQCQIRLPGICSFDSTTTVLAHFRLAGICGTGKKPPDECAAWACHSCHNAVDGRTMAGSVELAERWRTYHLEGVLRTLHELSRLGYKMKK